MIQLKEKFMIDLLSDNSLIKTVGCFGVQTVMH